MCISNQLPPVRAVLDERIWDQTYSLLQAKLAENSREATEKPELEVSRLDP